MLIVLLLQLTTSLASLCSFSSPKAQPKENGGNVVNTGDREERRGSTVSGSAHTVAGYSLSFSRRALASAAARAHCVCLSLCVYCVWKTERKRGARIHRHEPPMLCLTASLCSKIPESHNDYQDNSTGGGSSSSIVNRNKNCRFTSSKRSVYFLLFITSINASIYIRSSSLRAPLAFIVVLCLAGGDYCRHSHLKTKTKKKKKKSRLSWAEFRNFVCRPLLLCFFFFFDDESLRPLSPLKREASTSLSLLSPISHLSLISLSPVQRL